MDIKHFLKTGNFLFNNSYSHWTWKIRKFPIIGRIWYEMEGKTYRRPLVAAIRCWYEWDLLPLLK